jgi:hypothetical protein
MFLPHLSLYLILIQPSGYKCHRSPTKDSTQLTSFLTCSVQLPCVCKSIFNFTQESTLIKRSIVISYYPLWHK